MSDDPVEGLLAELAAIESRSEALTAGLDEAAFSWSPAPGRWSVGQCLEHLNLTADAFFPLLDRAMDQGKPCSEPAAAMRARLVARGFLGILEPPYKRGVKAPGPARPAPKLVMADVTGRFAEAQKKLGERIDRARGIDLNRSKMRHPAIPVVKFSVGEIFEILLAHERRHLWQAENVRREPAFPATG
jgi:hypothetical protein